MKTNFSILTITVITALLLHAGCQSNKLMKQANRHYDNEEYVSAAATYERVLLEAPEEDHAAAQLRLADCYRHMNRYAEAEKWYSMALDKPEASPLDRLHYAEVLKSQGKCEQANAALDQYLSLVPTDSEARKMREICELTMADTAKPKEEHYAMKRINLGVIGSSFSPTSRHGDTLIVSANAPLDSVAPMDERTGNGFNDLYIVAVRDGEMLAMQDDGSQDPNSGEYTGASGMMGAMGSTRGQFGPKHRNVVITHIEGPVNSEYHEGAAVLSPSGNVMYFTRSQLKNNRPVKTLFGDENHLELCRAEYVDGHWTNIRPLEFNDKSYSVGHPAITADGKRLYFVSDMPGGKGGTDIYYVDLKEDGEWSDVHSAGDNVNSDKDEMFPSIRTMPDGTEMLYFASNGLSGAENLDIYRAPLEDKKPGEVVRLAAPINTTYDDFGITFNRDGVSGYLSSDRANEEGKDHVYAFRQKPASFFVKAEVFYTGTNEPVKDINVQVQNVNDGTIDSMNTRDAGSIFFAADSVTTYSFAVRKEGYFAGVGMANTGGFDGQLMDTTYVKLYMDPIVINKPIRLENIYYDFDKWYIRPDAAVELDKLVKILKDNPTIKIELGSHCDARGSHGYNDRLSQRRAESAVNYIVSKGISRDRITAKGYGERVLLNRCADGVACTEEEHQWNRRTEFKVTEIVGGQQVIDSQPRADQ